MCGIFGVINSNESHLKGTEVKDLTTDLFRLSETRGKEAAGLSVLKSGSQDPIYVLKDSVTASEFIKTPLYREVMDKTLNNKEKDPTAIFGHSRLVTDGAQEIYENNQPVITEGVVGVHNGIVVNVDYLWKKYPQLQRKYDVDSEVILTLVRHFYSESHSVLEAIKKTFAEIRGTASVALTFEDLNLLVLATNNGSLYVAKNPKSNALIFASERFILETLIEKRKGEFRLEDMEISKIDPNCGLLIQLDSFSAYPFRFDHTEGVKETAANGRQKKIEALGPKKSDEAPKPSILTQAQPSQVVTREMEADFNRFQAGIKEIRRCTKCILPETVPFIEFDDKGVCIYCTTYRKIEPKGMHELHNAIDPKRKPGQDADCIMALSGGRDSSYGIHYLVNELKMKPIAYTYDWGMVTDLARRNISRMCSQLGVEHIVISADIKKKRENIRKNVSAWLKRPELGMVPLFMAGDKQFFWYVNVLKKQTRIDFDVWTFNLLEKTQFKDDYTGIKFWDLVNDAEKIGQQMTLFKKIRLGLYYSKNFLMNPGYLNTSLFDTFFAYISYYFTRQEYLSLFDYIPWDENEVNDVLINKYEWEVAKDTKSTWRIGDGTSPFYNYIYYVVGGFSENDTMRSNQIREGMMTREEAMALIDEDNIPRWDSMKWYCDTIGVDFHDAIGRINKIPQRYPS